MKNNRKIITLVVFLALFAISLFSISPEPTNAQSIGCCYSNSTGCFDSDQNNCNANISRNPTAGLRYDSNACSSLTNICTSGCCCITLGATTQAQYVKSQVMCQAGATFQPNQPESACPTACGIATLELKGMVRYNDGTIALANMFFYNFTPPSDTINIPYQTKNGLYSVMLPRDKQYHVTATSASDPSCSVSADVLLIGTITMNLDLPCAPPTACTSTYSWVWDNPARQCGHRTVTKTFDCPTDTSPAPPDYVPCVIVGGGPCGNGALDAGEDCDPGAVPPPMRNTGQSCSTFSFTGGTLTCTYNCKVSTDYCYSCPTNIGGCTSQSMCTSCASVCSGAPICQSRCQSPSIDPFTATPLQAVKGFRLQWNVQNNVCASIVQSYKLTRCEAQGGQCKPTVPLVTLNSALPSNILTYDDAIGASAAGQYCYELTAFINGGYLTTSVTRKVCSDITNANCVGKPAGEFCFVGGDSYDHRGQCSATGTFSDLENCKGNRCSGPTVDGYTSCQNVSICDYCNGPFSEFGYGTVLLEPKYQVLLSNGYTVYDCGYARTGLGYCFYEDNSPVQSVVGQNKACASVKSCYDYRTKSSCEQNPCTIAVSDDCQWKPIPGTTDELGLGVCSPVNVSQQDCGACDRTSPLGYCPKNVCLQYGSAGKCYYNDIIHPLGSGPTGTISSAIDSNHCMNLEDVGCETYDNVQECIGGTPFKANINYATTIPTGDNVVVQVSNDTTKFGKCVWANITNSNLEACMRDADSNQTNGYMNQHDCLNTVFSKDCLLANESPKTTLSIANNSQLSRAEIKGLSYFVDEKSNLKDGIITLFSDIVVATTPGTLYPHFGIDGLRSSVDALPVSAQGQYKIFYFSHDRAWNLEPVKTIIFNMIQGLSSGNVQITNSTKSWYVGGGVDRWLTNLTISVDAGMPLTCTSQLTSVTRPLEPLTGDDTKQSNAPGLSWVYSQLLDGTYFLRMRCWDTHLQSYEFNGTIRIDADTTIKNPLPSGLTLRPGPVDISIKTGLPASCYYLNDMTYVLPDDSTNNPADNFVWGAFNTDAARLNHAATVTESSTGMKFYFTKCRFDATASTPQHWFWGNAGDLIYFATDATAPTLTMQDVTTGAPLAYNYSLARDMVKLRFACNDSTPDLQYAGTDYDFGCDKILYCIKAPAQADCTPGTGGNVITDFTQVLTVNTANTVADTVLKVVVSDIGGNNRSYTYNLNLKNLTFVPPNVTICDPRTSVCA